VKVEHGATVSKRLTQNAGVDHKRDRILATAVDDAGNLALAA
jgi:hypothetical protein